MYTLDATATGYAEIEADLLRKDGTETPFLWSAAPLIGQDGRVIGLTGVGRDISERKQAERAVSQLSGGLIQLQDEERRRIGRELHDTTAQNLAGLAMNLSIIAQSRLRINQHARRALDESTALVDQCLREIRTISYLLHPPFLEKRGRGSFLEDDLTKVPHRKSLAQIGRDFAKETQRKKMENREPGIKNGERANWLDVPIAGVLG